MDRGCKTVGDGREIEDKERKKEKNQNMFAASRTKPHMSANTR